MDRHLSLLLLPLRALLLLDEVGASFVLKTFPRYTHFTARLTSYLHLGGSLIIAKMGNKEQAERHFQMAIVQRLVPILMEKCGYTNLEATMVAFYLIEMKLEAAISEFLLKVAHPDKEVIHAGA